MGQARANIRREFANKLTERLANPHVPAARLRGMRDCYKIKLRSDGYRPVHRVYDDRIAVQVVAVGNETAALCTASPPGACKRPVISQ